MSLQDYQARIDRLQRGLGKAFAESPFIFNIPGKSIALKVDPYYYVAFEPSFTEHLSKFSAMLKQNVRDTLVRTGNLVSEPGTRNPLIKIKLRWDGRTYALTGCFVEAEFIDQALKMYGGVSGDIGLSEMQILSSERENIDKFFGERTRLQSVAFTD